MIVKEQKKLVAAEKEAETLKQENEDDIMQIIMLWKSYNPDNLHGGYDWHINKVQNRWANMDLEPYHVELPDDFRRSTNTYGEEIYFKEGCAQGYQLTIENKRNKDSSPCLVGGEPVESVRLKVLEIVPEEERCGNQRSNRTVKTI